MLLYIVWQVSLFFLCRDVLRHRKSQNTRFSSVHHQPRLEFWENGHRRPGQGIFGYFPTCLCIPSFPTRHSGTDGWVATHCPPTLRRSFIYLCFPCAISTLTRRFIQFIPVHHHHHCTVLAVPALKISIFQTTSRYSKQDENKTTDSRQI